MVLRPSTTSHDPLWHGLACINPYSEHVACIGREHQRWSPQLGVRVALCRCPLLLPAACDLDETDWYRPCPYHADSVTRKLNEQGGSSFFGEVRLGVGPGRGHACGHLFTHAASFDMHVVTLSLLLHPPTRTWSLFCSCRVRSHANGHPFTLAASAHRHMVTLPHLLHPHTFTWSLFHNCSHTCGHPFTLAAPTAAGRRSPWS